MGEPNVYRFADLVLDVPNRRLTRRGAEIYLAPKTFDTLLVLVQRHGHLVTKRALLDAVWNDTAVTANALTQQISDLRDVLEDDARRPRFIRTLPRVGFTFIAPVECEPQRNRHQLARFKTQLLPGPGRPRLSGQRSRSLVLAIAAGFAGFGVRPGSPLSRFELVQSARVTSIAELVAGRPNRRLPQRPQRHLAGVGQSSRERRAPATDVSRESRFATALVRAWESNRLLGARDGNLVLAALGGRPRQLIAAGRNPDLSPDGRVLVFERPWEIWTANADGTNQRRVPAMKQGYLATTATRGQRSPLTATRLARSPTARSDRGSGVIARAAAAAGASAQPRHRETAQGRGARSRTARR